MGFQNIVPFGWGNCVLGIGRAKTVFAFEKACANDVKRSATIRLRVGLVETGLCVAVADL